MPNVLLCVTSQGEKTSDRSTNSARDVQQQHTECVALLFRQLYQLAAVKWIAAFNRISQSR